MERQCVVVKNREHGADVLTSTTLERVCLPRLQGKEVQIYGDILQLGEKSNLPGSSTPRSRPRVSGLSMVRVARAYLDRRQNKPRQACRRLQKPIAPAGQSPHAPRGSDPCAMTTHTDSDSSTGLFSTRPFLVAWDDTLGRSAQKSSLICCFSPHFDR